LTYDEVNDCKAFVVKDNPQYVNLSKLNTFLYDYLSEGSVYLEDRSQKNTEIYIGKSKGYRKPTYDEIERCVRSATSRTIKFRCYVAHEGKAQLLSPSQIIRASVETLSDAVLDKIKNDITVFSEKILFEKVKEKLARMLLDRESDENIMKTLDLSKDLYSKFSAKSISTLKSKAKDVSELNELLESRKLQAEDPLDAWRKDLV